MLFTRQTFRIAAGLRWGEAVVGAASRTSNSLPEALTAVTLLEASENDEVDKEAVEAFAGCLL